MSFDVEGHIRSVEHEYDFPTSLTLTAYRDNSRNCDIVQVYFRYNPFADGPEDKFGFEISCDNGNIDQKDALIDMKKREAHDGLKALEESWKQQFKFVYWRDVPYAVNDDDRVFTVKCELCHFARSIDKPGDFEHRRDLYLIYLLKEIEHDCTDGWSEPAGVDRDLWVGEGQEFPRIKV